MKVKHKMTKEFNDEIESAAKLLPRMAKFDRNGYPVYKTQVVDGLDLNMCGEVDKNGNKFAEGVKYTAPVLQYVNHKEQMMLIFKEKGMEGVREYIKEVNDRQAEMIKEAQTIRKNQRPINKAINYIKRIFSLKNEIKSTKNVK